MEKLDGAVTTIFRYMETWQNGLPAFQPSYNLAVRRSKQDAAQQVRLQPPSSNPTPMAPTRHRRNRLTIATTHLAFLCTITECISQSGGPARRHDSRLQGDAWVSELMQERHTIFFEETPMSRSTFRRLVQWIELNHRLIWQRNTSMSVEEMLIIFLWMVGHN